MMMVNLPFKSVCNIEVNCTVIVKFIQWLKLGELLKTLLSTMHLELPSVCLESSFGCVH